MSGEAEVAGPYFGHTVQRLSAVHFPPATAYIPQYFFTLYPPEITKLWNMLEMMDPPSYSLTFISMIAIALFMKWMTIYGKRIGLESESTELICVPFQ